MSANQVSSGQVNNDQKKSGKWLRNLVVTLLVVYGLSYLLGGIIYFSLFNASPYSYDRCTSGTCRYGDRLYISRSAYLQWKAAFFIGKLAQKVMGISKEEPHGKVWIVVEVIEALALFVVWRAQQFFRDSDSYIDRCGDDGGFYIQLGVGDWLFPTFVPSC